MSRRHRAEKRQVLPDPKFKDIVITKFMNQYCARFPFVAGEAIPLSTRLTSAHDTASVYL